MEAESLITFQFYILLYIKIKSQHKPFSGYCILKLTTKYFQKGGLFQGKKSICILILFSPRVSKLFCTIGWVKHEERERKREKRKNMRRYGISEAHWSEIVSNYHFKGRTPALPRQQASAGHSLHNYAEMVAQGSSTSASLLVFRPVGGTEASHWTDYTVDLVSCPVLQNQSSFPFHPPQNTENCKGQASIADRWHPQVRSKSCHDRPSPRCPLMMLFLYIFFSSVKNKTQNTRLGQMLWHLPIILALRRLRQEGQEMKTSP